MLCEIHTTCLPWTSLSFRNHRMLAAGLLPDVVHVRVITSPSIAGLVNPVISGRPGTPVVHGNIHINSTLNTYTAYDELGNNPVGGMHLGFIPLTIGNDLLTDLLRIF